MAGEATEDCGRDPLVVGVRRQVPVVGQEALRGLQGRLEAVLEALDRGVALDRVGFASTAGSRSVATA